MKIIPSLAVILAILTFFVAGAYEQHFPQNIDTWVLGGSYALLGIASCSSIVAGVMRKKTNRTSSRINLVVGVCGLLVFLFLSWPYIFIALGFRLHG